MRGPLVASLEHWPFSHQRKTVYCTVSDSKRDLPFIDNSRFEE